MSLDPTLTGFWEFARRKSLTASYGLGPTIACTRALATATRFKADGLMETGIGANVARFDHNPLTLVSLGLLIEQLRENTQVRTAEFDNAAWTKAGVTIDADAAVAPDGTTTMDRLAVAETDAAHAVFDAATTAADTLHLCALFVKDDVAGFASISFATLQDANNHVAVVWNSVTGAKTDEDLGAVSGTLDSFGAVDCGGGIWRLWFVGKMDPVNGKFAPGPSDSGAPAVWTTGVPKYDATAGEDTLFWGADTQAGSFLLSHIPTAAAAVTRNKDVYSTADVSFLGAANTFYFDFSTGNIDNDTTVWSLHDGTANERIAVEITGGDIHFIGVDGGAPQWDISVGAVADTDYKGAVAWAANDIAFYLNGAQVGVDGAATMPTVTTLNIGSDHADAEQLNSHFKAGRNYNVRKNNQFLDDLSSGLILENAGVNMPIMRRRRR